MELRERGSDGERWKEGGTEGGRRERSKSKTLFYKDCSLGSLRPVQQLVFPKTLLSKIKCNRERTNSKTFKLSDLGPFGFV